MSSGQDAYFYQLFLEKDEKLSLPTVQQLFEQSFLTSDVKLKEVPSCLIIQMPRYGKNFKMYPRILPSQVLDVTDIIEDCKCNIYIQLLPSEIKILHFQHLVSAQYAERWLNLSARSASMSYKQDRDSNRRHFVKSVFRQYTRTRNDKIIHQKLYPFLMILRYFPNIIKFRVYLWSFLLLFALRHRITWHL